MPELKDVKVRLTIPYIGGIEGTWAPDKAEQEAAWEMYVELATRISVVELKPDEGLLREALSSFYTLFDTTRKILRDHGPSVARPKGKDNISFGYIAIAILNGALRPVLAKWHPLLLDYESTRDKSVSRLAHERSWEKYEELRKVLNDVRVILKEYADILAQVAGVPSLMDNTDTLS